MPSNTQSGRLFDVVPENFFSPLASPGRLVYWECIRRLFAITSRQLSFGVERDILVDELEYYFGQELAPDIMIESEEEAAGGSPRDRANYIIRKLESCGWIYTDVDYSYVQRVNFRDYAIKVIRTLDQISSERSTEYQGYIYTIYNLARAKDSPGLALTQIVENTDLLITGLKSLNANIKKYIDDLTRHSTVAEILDALLNDYYINVVDKAYHRLMTSDNVSKFRPEIIERLEENSRSSRYLNVAAREIADMRDVSESDAREMALTMLHDVIAAFRQMDEILEQINSKNSRYQSAAVGRAKFLLTSSEDVRGQLRDIICALSDAAGEAGCSDHNMIFELEETDRLIRIFSWSYLDIESLYEPRQGRKEFISQEIEERQHDAAARDRQRRLFEERIRNVLSAPRIDEYVRDILREAGDDHIRASEVMSRCRVDEHGSDEEAAFDNETDESMKPDTSVMETFIRLIYVRLYGQRRNMSYRVVPGDIIRQDGFRYRDFDIISKGDGHGSI